MSSLHVHASLVTQLQLHIDSAQLAHPWQWSYTHYSSSCHFRSRQLTAP